MSLSQVVSQPYSSDPEDHLFISKHLERIDVGVGGYDKWAAGCICGFYTKGSPGRYIPSEGSARAIWNDHLRHVTGRDNVEPMEQELEEEVPEPNPFTGREREALDEILKIGSGNKQFVRVNVPIRLAEALRKWADRLLIEDHRGKATWVYDHEFEMHIPCCSQRPEGKFCLNGPLTGDQIYTGDCGEHN